MHELEGEARIFDAAALALLELIMPCWVTSAMLYSMHCTSLEESVMTWALRLLLMSMLEAGLPSICSTLAGFLLFDIGGTFYYCDCG